ncbi:MAG: hypothetical protein A4E72_01117 [Syntrophus sp. PtaU1.Bin208]|nr:MAG: hypothetical protein A4E72_01117 [Syntrophus sp. PtaU1.Bin208]
MTLKRSRRYSDLEKSQRMIRIVHKATRPTLKPETARMWEVPVTLNFSRMGWGISLELPRIMAERIVRSGKGAFLYIRLRIEPRNASTKLFRSFPRPSRRTIILDSSFRKPE